MNPKKPVVEYIKKQLTDAVDPAQTEQWRQVFDGMSTGTARIVIERQAGDELPAGYGVDLENRGRYFTARIVSRQGCVLRRLLVDKQTGQVRLL